MDPASEQSPVTPTSPPVTTVAMAPAPSIPPSKRNLQPLWLVILIVFGSVAGAAGYFVGKHSVPAIMPMADAGLSLPNGAIVTTECADALGKQYIEPKNIPNGPIYNVHDGKVIGLEMMFNASEIKATPSRFVHIDLGGHTYQYLNIESVLEGHAGNAEPHYHLDFFTADQKMVDSIKCSASEMNMTDMHSSDNTSGHATH